LSSCLVSALPALFAAEFRQLGCVSFYFPASSVISSLSLHDALPIFRARAAVGTDISSHLEALYVAGLAAHPRLIVELGVRGGESDRKSTRLNSSHLGSSYAVFCLKKKTISYSNCAHGRTRRPRLVLC